MIKAELLTKDVNPRTKCLKVSVPYKYRVLMENNELYPAGWRYRKFFASRNFRKLPEGGRRQGAQQGQVVNGGAGAAKGNQAGTATPAGAGGQVQEALEETQEVGQDLTAALQEARQEIAQLKAKASSQPPTGESEGIVTAQ